MQLLNKIFRRIKMNTWHSFEIGLLGVLCVLFMGQKVQAAGGYDIEQYHVDMKVSEENVYEITETIKVNFTQSRHGIYRNIPLINNVVRADGSTSVVHARVEDISCGGDKYSVSRANEQCQIKIGDGDVTITGEKLYTISYHYVMGKDVLKGADEFYFNIIGPEWEDTTIQNVSFSIQMPKKFDEKLLGMSYGNYGSTETEGIWFGIQGNTINGKLDSSIVLYPGQSLTVRLELPEGYFISSVDVPWTAGLSIVLGIAAIGIAYFLWNRYGKDDPVVETVEFQVPYGLNSIEASYVFKGYKDKTDAVSLLIYLAEKGYIEIMEGSGINPKKGFTLMKKKEYDGKNESERLFMQGLFASGDIVEKKDLENKFYTTVDAIMKHVEQKYQKKIFYPDSLNKNWILYLSFVIIFLLAGVPPIYQYTYSILGTLYILVFSGFAFVIAFSILFSGGKLLTRIISFVIVGLIAVSGNVLFLADAFHYAHPMHLVAFVFAVVTGGVLIFFSAIMSKRTPMGNDMLGKLRGFKMFLETAEKERLEAMVEENPHYFYEILPYTYVFGISDTWMEKFESITIEKPDWYRSHYNTTFNLVTFNHFMDSTMRAASSSMTSQPSSSGGGSSGGGSGGGGGGSW